MSHWHRSQHKQADRAEPRWSRQRWSQHSPPWPRADKKKWHFVWEPRPVTLSTLPEALRQNWKFHSQSKLINGPLPPSLWLTLHTLSHSKHVPETQQQTINCCQTCLSMSQSPRNLPPSETNCHSDCLWTRRLVPTYPRYHHSLIF